MTARTLLCDTLSNSTETDESARLDIRVIMGRSGPAGDVAALIIRAFVRTGYTPGEGRRFANKVRLDPETGCWIWTACLNSKGYGCLGLRKVSWLAHRLAHVIFLGPIPEGYEVDHVRERGCKSTACVNPDHLEAVTPEVNAERARQRPRPCPALLDLTTGRSWDLPAPSDEDRRAADLIGARLGPVLDVAKRAMERAS
jgi:hypothetical protein